MKIERRVLPRGLGQWLKSVVVSLLFGATIGFVFWVPERDEPFLLSLGVSAWIGLCIYFTCMLALAFFAPYIDFERGRLRLWIPLSLIFFVAGGVGFYIGAASLGWLSFGRIAIDVPGWSDGFAFAGVLGLVGGALFFSYERLKDQLRASMERVQKQELAENELEMARKIQRRILPPATLEREGFRLAARNLPARVVAGDFYDVLPRTDGVVGVVVADVVGKGMGASLIMAGVKARLGYVASGRSVTETMDELNRTLIEELGEREFVALCYACFDPATGRFELSNAGLPDPYLLEDGAPPRPLATAGPRLPLGVRADVGYGTVEGVLPPGASLLLLTDGIPESLTPAGEPLGYAALEAALPSGDGGEPPADRLDALIARLEAATSGARDDDWTLVLLERRA